MDNNGHDSKAEPDKEPAHDQAKNPKKRRKVNHACIYCRRSHMTCDLERPCTRCIKRNIGHLCHDEPRDSDSKKAKSTHGASVVDDSETQASLDQSSTMGPPPPSFADSGNNSQAGGGGAKPNFGSSVLAQAGAMSLVRPQALNRMQNNSNMNQFAGFSDAWLTAQNHLHDMHNYNPNYMIAPEVTHEFNLLNDFLHTSLLDDGGLLPDEVQSSPTFSQSTSGMLSGFGDAASTGGLSQQQQQTASLMPPPTTAPPATTLAQPAAASAEQQGRDILRSGSAAPGGPDRDKAREYYMQAADPSGNDTPEERMQRVLRAKYEAGLLKPFNYIRGYRRLQSYIEGHIAPASKDKITRTLLRFRPKFREKAQRLTDMELVMVEMWFERQLMDYDRVFASMAVPSCCWRRTGEIFRGNKEMAELIHIPVERLRDGNVALHEIMTEASLVRYWEEFETIAFDPDHDSLLTACTLKSPDDESKDPVINCCFSFMIRRDDHKMPTLIVGNFLPHLPSSS